MEASISKRLVSQLLFLRFEVTDNSPGAFSRSAYRTGSNKLQVPECPVTSQHEALPGPLIITDRPTGLDWAHSIQEMLGAGDADADRMVLVMDNLNTPNIVSLYLAFSPDHTGSLAKERKTRHTPKHGSWLDDAGIGLGDL